MPLRWKTRRLLGSRRANATTNRSSAAKRPFSGRSSVVFCRDGTRQRFTHVAEPFADTFLLGDVTVASDRVQPRLARWPPRAPLRGGASHEAEGRRGARAGRVRAPTGRRLCVLRQIGDQLIPGLEEFLFVDDVVAVEDGAGLVAGQEHGDPARGHWRGSGCGRRCGGNRGGSGSVRQPPDRRCATPCASGGRGCRRGGRPAGYRGRGVPVGAPGPRQSVVRSGESAPPTSSSGPGESRMTPPASSSSSQVRPRISFLRQPE